MVDGQATTPFARAVYSAERPPRSKIEALLRSMPPEDVEAFKAAVKLVEGDRDKPQNERFFTVQWLTNILNENGYTIGKTSVSEYLRKAET